MYIFIRRPQINLFIFLCAAISVLFSNAACNKTEGPERNSFKITFNNEFTLLEAKFGAFLTQEDGKVVAFSWLNGNTITDFGLDYAESETYNCTIVKITYTEAPGSPEDVVQLTTYHQLKDKTIINLRDLSFEQESNIKLQFTNITSLDSLIFPEGTALIRPQESTNYFGNFTVNHTGDFWLLAKFNGDPDWRYITFKNFAQTTNTLYIDANLMSKMHQVTPTIKLPFNARWRYHLDGVLNVENKKIIPLGDTFERLESSVSLGNNLYIHQPEDIVIPEYKVELVGTKAGVDGYTYKINRFYNVLPTLIEAPTFNIMPTLVNDNRRVGVRCEGNFDALVMTRTIEGTPQINWSVYAAPALDGNVSHELPELPRELGLLYPQLSNYAFGSGIKVRAEQFKFLMGYDEVLSNIFDNSDPFWQTKNELLSVEKTF